MGDTDHQANAEETATKEVQPIEDGSGPTYHRVYRVRLNCSMDVALKAMAKVQADPNHFSPKLLARFEKTEGPELKMEVGDAFQIHISGPWNGPVRVKQVCPDSFMFVTLEGHMEAGRIVFRVCKRDGAPHFEIESVARSKNGIVDFLYDKIPVARFAQTMMWEKFCKSFVEEATGETVDQIDVMTERRENV